MKKNKLLIIGLSLTMVFGATACNKTETAETTTTNTETESETTKETYAIKEYTLKNLVKQFGAAIVERDYDKALQLGGVEDRTFVSDANFEEYINSGTLKGLLDYPDVATFETDFDENGLYAAYNGEDSDTASFVITSKDIFLYATQVDKDTAEINMADFITENWRIEIPEGGVLYLDDVDVTPYQASEEAQTLDSGFTVYEIPTIGLNVTKHYRLELNGQTFEGDFTTRGFLDGSTTRINAEGTVVYNTPDGEKTEENITAILQQQIEGNKYEIPSDAVLSTDIDGNVLVINSDGSQVTLDENGNVISKVESTTTEE